VIKTNHKCIVWAESGVLVTKPDGTHTNHNALKSFGKSKVLTVVKIYSSGNRDACLKNG